MPYFAHVQAVMNARLLLVCKRLQNVW